MKVYTIGHSTAELRAFLGALRERGVEVLVDVRSKPRSRIPHFDQYPLQTAVEEAGLRYRFAGDRLGGVPRDPAVAARWRQGRLDEIIVDHLRSTDDWHDGISELVRLARSGGGTAICIMCSEADPNECHRKAVALDLREQLGDAEIVHISVTGEVHGEVGVQEVLL
ncbi:MAG TPA: DUF488 domain-containing protein [Dehalococcoidia bacterium]|nr:DUF488 domain-containing protein [Dehalococcoidia bacterium]